MPKFSIVVPIYNVEKYIGACIDSVLNQTYGEFELILVDDGSPDRSPAICDDYAKKDHRIKVIHKKNGGVVSAREKGVENASNEYLIFIDGDDWIREDTLAIYKEILENHHPDLIINTCADGEETNLVKRQLPYREGLYSRSDIEKDIFPILIEGEDGRYFSSSIWGKVYKTQVYRDCQGPLDYRVKIAEDQACIRPYMVLCNSMFILNEALYNYRTNNESATKKPRPFAWEGPKIVGQHFEANMDMTYMDFQQQVYRSVVHNLFNVAVSRFYQDKGYGEVKKEILQWLKDPYYQNAIQNCKYKNYRQGSMAEFALKHRNILLVYLYSIYKIKNIK